MTPGVARPTRIVGCRFRGEANLLGAALNASMAYRS
jgi:hypothetical protein